MNVIILFVRDGFYDYQNDGSENVVENVIDNVVDKLPESSDRLLKEYGSMKREAAKRSSKPLPTIPRSRLYKWRRSLV